MARTGAEAPQGLRGIQGVEELCGFALILFLAARCRDARQPLEQRLVAILGRSSRRLSALADARAATI